jgi:hypothetical protein
VAATDSVAPEQLGQGALVSESWATWLWAGATIATSRLVTSWLGACSFVSWSMVVPFKTIFGLALLGSPGDDKPAVDCDSPAFTAAAGYNSQGVGHMLDGVAQPNIFVANESWKSHTVWLGFALGYFLRHGLYYL